MCFPFLLWSSTSVYVFLPPPPFPHFLSLFSLSLSLYFWQPGRVATLYRSEEVRRPIRLFRFLIFTSCLHVQFRFSLMYFISELPSKSKVWFTRPGHNKPCSGLSDVLSKISMATTKLILLFSVSRKWHGVLRFKSASKTTAKSCHICASEKKATLFTVTKSFFHTSLTYGFQQRPTPACLSAKTFVKIRSILARLLWKTWRSRYRWLVGRAVPAMSISSTWLRPWGGLSQATMTIIFFSWSSQSENDCTALQVDNFQRVWEQLFNFEFVLTWSNSSMNTFLTSWHIWFDARELWGL